MEKMAAWILMECGDNNKSSSLLEQLAELQEFLLQNPIFEAQETSIMSRPV